MQSEVPTPGIAGMDLPTGLAGMSEERREQLLARAQTEIAEAEADGDIPGVPAPSTAERTTSYAVLFVCGVAFLSLLRAKLESIVGDGESSLTWPEVFAPLLVMSGLDLCKHTYKAAEWVGGQRQRTSPWVLAQRLLDSACTLACVVDVTLRLAGAVPANTSWLILLVPAWVGSLGSTAMLCCTPTPPALQSSPQAVEAYRSSLCVTGAFHLIQSGLQVLLVALKLDGTITGSWAAVFTPCWIFLSVSALFYGVTICVLFGACCVVIGANRTAAELRAFICVWLGQVSMVVAWTVCLFMFLVYLTERLDGNDNISPAQIIAPLLALVVVLPLLVPINHLAERALHSARARAAAEQDAGGGGAAAAEDVVLEALPAPTALMRQSSTYFRRATSSLISRFAEDGDGDGGGGSAGSCGADGDGGDGSNLGTHIDVEAAGGGGGIGATGGGGSGKEDDADGSLESLGLAARRQSDVGSRTCYICQTEAADAVLMECGHGGVCYECGLSLLKVGAHQRCPICRADVVQVLRLAPGVMAAANYNQIVQTAEGVKLQRRLKR